MAKAKKTSLANPDAMVVLEERFDVAPATDPARIQLSERQRFTTGQFNTLKNPVTREVTITGIHLRWDGSTPLLEALKLTRDVTRIVLIADEIRIEQPLRWKGASVEIYARRLVFRGQGRIETTPEPVATVAFSENRSGTGRPLDEAGKVKAKDGVDGEAGGDIHLFVADLDGGSDGELRLVTDGAPGQMGEEGGRLDFVARKGGPPGKDVTPVTKKEVEEALAHAKHSTPDLGDVKHWKTPGGVGALGLDATWNELTADRVVKNQLLLFSEHSVTDVRIGLGFWKFLGLSYQEIQLPSREALERHVVAGRLALAELWKATAELGSPWIPSDGENAYPSGTTGRGGAAGRIVSSAPDRLLEASISSRGGASPLSPDVAGGEAGTPRKYLYGAFGATQFVPDPIRPESNFIKEAQDPQLVREGGTTKPGKSAKGSAKGAGADGGPALAAGALDWMEPRLLRIMADHARELYGAGHRLQAFEVLTPYWMASRDLAMTAPDPETRSSLRAIETLIHNHQQNLDVYGNPPGWVPRFSASNYLRTFLADRKFSYRFVGVMDSATRLMSSLEHAHAMLGDLSDRTEDVIEQLRGELFEAYVGYDASRDTLDEVQKTLKDAQQKLDALEKEAERRALVDEQDKAILRAVFDVSAAVLAAIPVYQPALAGVGAIVAGVGSVVTESLYGEEPPNGWDALATIAGSVAEMLDDNADSFKDQLTGKLKTKYKDKLDPDAADLRTQVARMRTAIAEGQEAHDAAILSAHDLIAGDGRFSDLLSADAEAARRLTENESRRDEVLRDIKHLNQALEDVGPPNGEHTRSTAARAGRQRLLVARAKLYTLLANAQNEARDLRKQIQAREGERAEGEARLSAVELRRSELEDKNAALTEVLPEFEKIEATDRIKEAGKTFGKVLDGAERMAKGASAIGRAISGAITPPDPESEAVVALRARILNSDLGEPYAKIQAKVDEATARMSQALQDLMVANQNVSTLTADFAGALQTSIDIAQNRQAFALGVDAGLRASLGAMQQQARQRMDYYLYLFRRAYMYEFCAPAGNDIGKLNTFIEHIDKWLKNSRAALAQGAKASPEQHALRGLVQLSNMTDGEIGDIGNDAMRSTLSELASKLLQRRQAQGVPLGNVLIFPLSADFCAALTRERRVSLGRALDLIEDPKEREAFFFENPLLKVTGVSIGRGDFAFRAGSSAPKNAIRIVVQVGREFVLWDGAQHVMFRVGRSEKPLEFGFVANRFERGAEDGLWVGDFVADSRGGVDDVFKTVMGETTGQTIQYSEINPSFLSTLSASIVLGGNQIEEILRFRLTLGWQAN